MKNTAAYKQRLAEIERTEQQQADKLKIAELERRVSKLESYISVRNKRAAKK